MMRYSVSTPILPRAKRGFTLIELMVVIAIIGILAAIAYPNYQESVKRANRNDAKGVVMGAAQALERYALQNNTYKDADLGAGGIYTDKSPIDGSQRVYTLSLDNLDVSTYTIIATPEAGGPNAGDGDLTLTETGEKKWIKGSVTKSWNEN